MGAAGSFYPYRVLNQVPCLEYRGIRPLLNPHPVGVMYLFPATCQDVRNLRPILQMRVAGQLFFLQMGLDDQAVVQLGIHMFRTAYTGQKLRKGLAMERL